MDVDYFWDVWQNPPMLIRRKDPLSLPTEIVRMILLRAGGQGACQMECFGSFYRSLGEDRVFWKALYKREFQLEKRLVFFVDENEILRPKFAEDGEFEGDLPPGTNPWKESFKLLYSSRNMVGPKHEHDRYNRRPIVSTDIAERTSLVNRIVLMRKGHVEFNFGFPDHHYQTEASPTVDDTMVPRYLCWIGVDRPLVTCFEHMSFVITSSVNLHNLHFIRFGLNLNRTSPDRKYSVTLSECRLDDLMLVANVGWHWRVSFVDCIMPAMIAVSHASRLGSIHFCFNNCLFNKATDLSASALFDGAMLDFEQCTFTNIFKYKVNSKAESVILNSRFEKCCVIFHMSQDKNWDFNYNNFLVYQNTFEDCEIRVTWHSTAEGAERLEAVNRAVNEFRALLYANNTFIDNGRVRNQLPQ